MTSARKRPHESSRKTPDGDLNTVLPLKLTALNCCVGAF